MKLTVKEAARLMDSSEGMVRRGLQQGVLPIGVAVAGAGNRFTYYIDHRKVAAFLRRDPGMVAKVVTVWRGETDAR